VNQKRLWDDEKLLEGKDEEQGEEVVEKTVDEDGAADRTWESRGAG